MWVHAGHLHSPLVPTRKSCGCDNSTDKVLVSAKRVHATQGILIRFLSLLKTVLFWKHLHNTVCVSQMSFVAVS